jgi:ATP-dependent DNA helicase RecQ
MSGKPVAEQEIGFALLLQVVVPMPKLQCERKFYSIILVEFDSETGEGADMDDNVRNQSKVEAQE